MNALALFASFDSSSSSCSTVHADCSPPASFCRVILVKRQKYTLKKKNKMAANFINQNNSCLDIGVGSLAMEAPNGQNEALDKRGAQKSWGVRSRTNSKQLGHTSDVFWHLNSLGVKHCQLTLHCRNLLVEVIHEMPQNHDHLQGGINHWSRRRGHFDQVTRWSEKFWSEILLKIMV